MSSTPSNGTDAAASRPDTRIETSRSRGALLRYRVMAWVTGVLLITLVFIAVPIEYIGHNDTPVAIIGQVHGYLYIVYLVAAADLARRVRFSYKRMVAMFLAGLVPTVAFFCERRVTDWVREYEQRQSA